VKELQAEVVKRIWYKTKQFAVLRIVEIKALSLYRTNEMGFFHTGKQAPH
jgi:hypothetical protein